MFSLVFLGVNIFDAIQMASVSFIKSRVSPWILHKKIVWGCLENSLNSGVFWSKIEGVKIRRIFTRQADFAVISTDFICCGCHFHTFYLLWLSFYTTSTNIFHILLTNIQKWLERKLFTCWTESSFWSDLLLDSLWLTVEYF